MTPTPIATPARQIKGILEAKYRNPKRTIKFLQHQFQLYVQQHIHLIAVGIIISLFTLCILVVSQFITLIRTLITVAESNIKKVPQPPLHLTAAGLKNN